MKRYAAEEFYASTAYMIAPHHAWSTDDTRLLISSDATGVFNTYWLVGETGELEALTQDEKDNCVAVSAFPEDDRVLFTGDQGGNELNHLFVREVSGEVRDLTPGDGLRALFGRWADDGGSFYVATNARDASAFDVYRYDATSYAAELVFRNDGGFLPAGFDGHGRLALLKAHSNSDSDLYVYDADSNEPEPRLLTPHEGDVEYGALSFTPDGGQLVVSTNEHGEFNEAWAIDLETGSREPVVSADWDVQFVGFSRTGRYRYSAINEDARTSVLLLDQESGETVELDRSGTRRAGER